MRSDDVLREQVEYYRARAPEYDEWWQRQRSFDAGPEQKARWDAEVDEVAGALDVFAPSGRVLEVASGTGWWTQRLAGYASELVCLDTSPETIERARTRAPGARFVCTDVFDWEPDGSYDVVFFSFWLSHVPDERFEAFWSLVDRALTDEGRVFFVDNLRPAVTMTRQGRSVRRLNDGREFTIVKVYYEPADLESRLQALGWDANVLRTETYFLHGTAQPGGRVPSTSVSGK